MHESPRRIGGRMNFFKGLLNVIALYLVVGGGIFLYFGPELVGGSIAAIGLTLGYFLWRND